jgi:hypothetical protein
MTDQTIIPLTEHPHNLDPSATLVTGPREPKAIYRVSVGYVACLEELRCFAGTFETQEAARIAQAGVT